MVDGVYRSYAISDRCCRLSRAFQESRKYPRHSVQIVCREINSCFELEREEPRDGEAEIRRPLDPDTDVRTVINEASPILFQERVNDAIDKGATLLYGNDRQDALYSAAVLDHISFDCELVLAGRIKPMNCSVDGNARIVRPHKRASVLGVNALLGEKHDHTVIAADEISLCLLPIPVINAIREQDAEAYSKQLEYHHKYLKQADT
jgi:hypothetical protein